MMEMTIGKRIGQLRRARGMTQDTMAEQLGVSPQAVSKWENDQTCPDISLLPKLARTLGVTVDHLLTGEQEETHQVQTAPDTQRKRVEDMVLRISMDTPDGKKLRYNLPMSLARMSNEMGSILGGLGALKIIDLQSIVDMANKGIVGDLLEVEAEGYAVRVFVEE